MQAFCVVMLIASSTIRACASLGIIICNMATQISSATLAHSDTGAITIRAVCF